MKIQEIMSSPISTVTPDIHADHAWAKMKELKIHHLVVMEKGQAVGILSNRDLGGERGQFLRRGNRVKDLMSEKPVTITPQTTVKRAANILRGKTIGCLPVVENGKPIGIITVSDLLEWIGQGGHSHPTVRPKTRLVRNVTRKR